MWKNPNEMAITYQMSNISSSSGQTNKQTTKIEGIGTAEGTPEAETEVT